MKKGISLLVFVLFLLTSAAELIGCEYCSSYSYVCTSYDIDGNCTNSELQCTNYYYGNYVNIDGYITNKKTGRAVIGATVQISSNSQSFNTSTNNFGYYSFREFLYGDSSGIRGQVCAQLDYSDKECQSFFSFDSCATDNLYRDFDLNITSLRAPTLYGLTSTSTSQLSLFWAPPGGIADGYYLAIRPGNVPAQCDSVVNGIELPFSSSYSHTFNFLQPNTLYTVSICSVDSKGNVSPQATATGYTLPPTPPKNATIPYYETFTISDGNFGSEYWRTEYGGFLIKNQKLVPVSPTDSMALLNGASIQDVEVRADVTLPATGNSCVQLAARHGGNGDNNFYLGSLCSQNGSYVASIHKNVNQTWTLLKSTTVPSGTGIMRFTTFGQNLMLFLGSQNLLTVIDTTFPNGGRVGIRAYGVGGTFDNFQATAYAPLAQGTCSIQIFGNCQGHPEYNSFNGLDIPGMISLGSGNSATACAKRASDYFAMCDGASSVQSTFGLTKAVTLVQKGGPGTCSVKILGSCLRQPSYNNFDGTDIYGMAQLGAGTNASVCARRASDYSSWCGGSAAVETTFGSTGAITRVEQRACTVEVLGTCLGHTTFNNYNGIDEYGTIYLNAGNDAAACARRASDFSSWCGGKTPIRTTFGPTGKVTYVGPRTCSLQVLGTCTGHPEFNNFNGLDDYGMNYLNAGNDAAVCARRARDYYSWCGSKTTIRTTFGPTGVITQAP